MTEMFWMLTGFGIAFVGLGVFALLVGLAFRLRGPADPKFWDQEPTRYEWSIRTPPEQSPPSSE